MKTPPDSQGAVTRRSLEGGKPGPTDFARWRKVAQETPSWDGRNQLIASLIPPGSSVLDVGAGAMTLSRYLARDTQYTPMDTVAASQQTVPVDFNACQIPELSRSYDFAVCSGVLEYIQPVHLFLDTVARWAHTIILSYATSDLTPGATARRRNGWLNHLSDAELRRLFVAHGLCVKSTIPWEQQLIYILDTSNASRFVYYSPETVQNRADIVSVFRYDPANVGDFFCAPFRYLNFGSLRCVDILGLDESLSLPPNLIVGGGGLLGSSTFDPWFRKLFDRSHEQVVGWGLGDNSRIDVHSGYVEPGKCPYPDYVKRFTLLGVRDSGTAYPWVPCASCLHPLFAQTWEIKNEVVVFEHKRVPIRIEGFPKMNNDTHDLSRIVRFLGTARVVITNSYHGAYWSQLLGKGVLAFPFSSKFYSLKHKVTLCKPAEWKKYLERVEEQPPALRECIQANLDFERKVRALLGLPQPAPAAAGRCEEGNPRKPMPNLKTSITGSSATIRASHSPASAPILVEGRTQTEHRPTPSAVEPPTVPGCKEVRLTAPPVGEALDRFLDSLGPGDVVRVPDSEDARFDALKLRLFELEHVGRDPHTKKQTWRGAKEQRPSCPPLQAHHTPPTVICFYTVDTPYAELAKRLQASCEQLSLPHRIEGIPSQGSWEFNCAFKSRFILAKWRELKAPILWVDADAIVRRFPALLACVDADFAIHKVDRWEFASGTAFFNQTENALRLLESWIRHSEASPALWDQQHLDAAWQETADRFPLKTLWLPQSYTRIFDRAVLPGEDPSPVIEHFQASRDLKQTISNLLPTPLREFPPDFIAARSVSRPFRGPSGDATPEAEKAAVQGEPGRGIAEKSPSEKPVVASSKRPAKVVVLAPDPNHPLYQSWIPHCRQPVLTVNRYGPDWEPPGDTALLVTHDTYTEPGMTLIRRAVAKGVPTLILADGILEYRNTWEHPQLVPGAMFQPVLGHKIACIGRSQARILESWGNIGKCEIVGAPRFDRYQGRKRRQRRPGDPFRVLITTALTPYFTETHRRLVVESLRDLKDFLLNQPRPGAVQLEAGWRLTKGLEQDIGVNSNVKDLTGLELAEVLQQVDAVITTPSTTMLEAMLLDLPVAVLDYTNTPHYVPSAWRITAHRHIAEVLAELTNPPEPKLLFQDTALHDALECTAPATPRLLQLIERMIAIGREQYSTRPALVLPRRILPSSHIEFTPSEERFRPDALYPAAPARAEPATTSPIPAASPHPVAAQAPARKKILFISHDASRTGAPIFLLNFLRWLRQHTDWEVRIVLRAGGPLEADFRQCGETHVWKDIQAGPWLLEDVALIYSNTCTNGLFLKSLPCGDIPIVTHVHELNYTIEIFGAENFAAVKEQTSHYIACAEAVAANLRSRHGIPAGAISVHYEAIPVKAVQDLAQAGPLERAALGLSPESFVIAACGFADWRKGPDLFLQLAASLQRRLGAKAELDFVWVGHVPPDERGMVLRNDLERLGLSSVRVTFVGEQVNPQPWLNACDLFCLPSREDPFPLVMLEAAALGKPLVCFENSGGAAEFCRRGGGFSVPYLDVEALSRKCLALMEDTVLLRKTGEAAARLAREAFDLSIIAPNLLTTIASFARQPSSSPASQLERARRLWEQANGEFDRGNHHAARTVLRQARELAPQDPHVATSLGLVESALANWDEALVCLSRAAELNPENAMVHLHLALVFVQKDRLNEARMAARRTLDLDPRQVEALRLLAGFAQHEGRYDEGAELYAQILRLAQGDLDALVGQGNCSLMQGHHVLARLLFEEVLELAPDHAAAAAGLSACSRRSPEPIKANLQPTKSNLPTNRRPDLKQSINSP